MVAAEVVVVDLEGLFGYLGPQLPLVHPGQTCSRLDRVFTRLAPVSYKATMYLNKSDVSPLVAATNLVEREEVRYCPL